jgi:hypothetical protein
MSNMRNRFASASVTLAMFSLVAGLVLISKEKAAALLPAATVFGWTQAGGT